jgi:hypothetical protein
MKFNKLEIKVVVLYESSAIVLKISICKSKIIAIIMVAGISVMGNLTNNKYF